eukprot:CAMPEP_0170541010 /NCGR_PEP_ID=MMETSP0211-20121228/870_1 /TAXON_ID=311385 /ORGANISM="Pseudokeronopsis sp., Strain OXSARD2" /LENGTH=59 /DNA_ID=CAMNT_0010843593 /DNA_START=93 /DNA_END=272 /DNA_ORIENTATION=-
MTSPGSMLQNLDDSDDKSRRKHSMKEKLKKKNYLEDDGPFNDLDNVVIEKASEEESSPP